MQLDNNATWGDQSPQDNRRQIAEAEQRQREFEERQRKELKSAKERDRQAYRERGWPSG